MQLVSACLASLLVRAICAYREPEPWVVSGGVKEHTDYFHVKEDAQRTRSTKKVNGSQDVLELLNKTLEAEQISSTELSSDSELLSQASSDWSGVRFEAVAGLVGTILWSIFTKNHSRQDPRSCDRKARIETSVAQAGAVRVVNVVQDEASETLRTRFHELIREGNLVQAGSTLSELELRGKPSLTEYNSIISSWSKAGDAEQAYAWLQRAKKAGMQRNSVCFNSVMNAYAKSGNMKLAIGVALEMKDEGIQWDTVTYNTLIDGCARDGDVDSAEFWMNTMLQSNVKASVVSIGSVMLACARVADLRRTQHWLAKADELGIEVNMICFSAVINAFSRAGDFVSAEYWMAAMLKRGVKPSIHCFLGFVEAALKAKDFAEADAICQRMRANGVEPDGTLYSSVVLACARAGDTALAQRWADEATAGGHRLNRTAKKFVVVSPEALAKAPARKPMTGEACDALDCQDVGSQGRSAAQQEALESNASGKRYVGTIKNFLSNKFGYITCEETYDIFKRDVFLSSSENPSEFGKGQRVSFYLFMDPKRHLPRASQLQVYTG